MSVFGVKLPDVGEGIAEAELVEWLVRVGDHVTAESPLAEVLTDKATVEIASPVSGVVTFLHGEPGDVLAIGTDFVGIEIDGSEPDEPAVDEAAVDEAAVAAPSANAAAMMPAPASAPSPTPAALVDDSPGPLPTRPTAAPAVRQRARELGIDLHGITGTGPEGHVVHADLDRVLDRAARTAPVGSDGGDDVRIEPVRGLRRRIAERLTQAWTEIPHITYVEEIDLTEIERLRTDLNRAGDAGSPRVTLLPFLVKALTIACREQPRLNAHYDAEQGTLSMFPALNVGIATQTPDGLLVPVVHGAERRGLWDVAAEITRLATAARDGSATRHELSGSTITITSLGALGGIMTTPILNRPEVAIVGVNKMETRPVWRDGAFVPRTVCNLSSSFDHRIVDGWDAATFVQRLKALLETPALLFIDSTS